MGEEVKSLKTRSMTGLIGISDGAPSRIQERAIKHLQYAHVTSNTWLPRIFLQFGFLYITIRFHQPI